MTCSTQLLWGEPKPCSTCHWFGYLMAENPRGRCVRPGNYGTITSPASGCAFWTYEPGTDDVQPPRLQPDDPARAVIERERDRLVKIHKLGERARLPHGIWPEVRDRSGILTHTGIPEHRRDIDPAELDAKIERLGVNAAIRAGRL